MPGRNRKHVRLDPEMFDLLKVLAKERQSNVNAEINKAVKQYPQRETAFDRDSDHPNAGEFITSLDDPLTRDIRPVAAPHPARRDASTHVQRQASGV